MPSSPPVPEAAERVILVDEHDQTLGSFDKLDAHRRGLLHRAFSVVLENDRGELLLQQRAAHKYHSPGLWSNACCGHPRPGETVNDAATRRVSEELGVHVVLRELGSFSYRAEIGELVEHELDHVLIGRLDEAPHANPDEVSDCRWVSRAELEAAMGATPGDYTAWLAGVMRVAAES